MTTETSDARRDILAAIRRNEPHGDFPLPEVHVFKQDQGDDIVAHFTQQLTAMGGKVLDLSDGLQPAIACEFSDAKVIASAVQEVPDGANLHTLTRQQDVEDVDVAVVRAAFAVAETGSVALTDTDLVVNSVAYLAQHLVVLVDESDIVPGLQEAYLRPEMMQHAYLAFHSGPSATADIEGVLIHGAQGVRSLHVAFVPRSS